jgi:SAM-dependent methyltransferase
LSHLYDRIGQGYTAVRREDPTIAAAVHAALGDARSIVNVGAGAGSYEPRDRDVIAVEPSPVMLAQRPVGAAPAVQASAESLPFADDSFDAAMAVLSDHHWPDRPAGLRELRRVARCRAVVFQCDLETMSDFWLVRDYLTTFRETSLTMAELAGHLGAQRIEPVPIPHDCRDGFFSAYWRRPHAYLDPRVRDGISVFRLMPQGEVDTAIERLRADLESGAGARRNADILERDAIDLGYRLIVAEYGA